MSLDREKPDLSGTHPHIATGDVRDISGITGLPLRVDRTGRIEFLQGLPRVEPQPRALDEMRSVLYNQTATGPDPLYYMYREMGWPEDIDRFAKYGLRYDLTVLAAGLVGGEYVKTAGHYHPVVRGEDRGGNGPDGGGGRPDGDGGRPDGDGGRTGDGRGARTYPELYQVISGRAHYLLQKPADNGKPGSIEDVVIVEAGPGDTLYVPPGYGHVTINPGPEPLVMVNVVSRAFSSAYGPYRERHGAVYYEIEEDGQGYFIPNDHYPEPPQPRLGRPTEPASLGLEAGRPLYAQLAANPRAFTFLSQPPPGGPVP